MNALEYLQQLRDKRTFVEVVLVNTTQREGTAFWYQLIEPIKENKNTPSKVYHQFKANGWLKATEYIKELNQIDKVYKWILKGSVTIPCNKVNNTVKPPCGTCPK